MGFNIQLGKLQLQNSLFWVIGNVFKYRATGRLKSEKNVETIIWGINNDWIAK